MKPEQVDDPMIEVREIENLFIPLADGTRLAARIWLPRDAESNPVPAILEYIPYRKRDFMRLRDEPIHHYFAEHGYAAVRVDLRGSGDSDGVLDDEYLPLEQEDAIEVIAWLVAQPWCDGSVGMTGISWGGFNSLQVAAHRPPALKAIITLCASDDRYSDDAHYMGGCLLNENQMWGTVLFALNALPPDPELVGERWREMWMQRLEHNRPFPAYWLRHPHRDAYWKQGSVCENFARIRCPVYAIGGWADGYSNAVPRLLEGLSCPRKGLVGPWTHSFPHNAVPGPCIGYLQEALRWWDQWLKGIDTGVMQEPMLRVWMQDYVEPEPFHEQRPGRWVAEHDWPSERIEPRHWRFTGAGALADAADEPARLDICSPQNTGLAGGDWCGMGDEGEAPLDQRSDDGRSLCFDSAPLDEALEILGVPAVKLRLASDRPVAILAVRLNDVAPDGTSARVSFGLLNLTHRLGHEHPQALVPGEFVDAVVEMNAIAHRLEADHVIRVAVSTAYWPMVWPVPKPVTLTLDTAGCSLGLPLRPPDPRDDTLPLFAPADAAGTSSTQTPLEAASFTRSIERDLVSNEIVYRLVSKGGDIGTAAVARIEEIDLDIGHHVERLFRIDERDPLSASSEIVERLTMRRGQWGVRVSARTRLGATATHFILRAWLSVLEGENEVFSREWEERIERNLL
ncbi:MAG: CocE/NonD family hydrolase [Gammaproteobacteria bacterium]|nr:MAG: CocE/NonD family hydrolase [Gammaproteobacteria bacterium]UCH38706.1 MAG: CocE/NonD family hydrolase [Gammaproteobacteria bacterium]